MTDTTSAPPVRHAHDLPFGAACLGPDRTRFRLWAPDAVEAWVDIDQGEAVRMAPEPGGWHAATVPVGAGTCYRYRVTNREGITLTVPDPAARAQWQDVHGPSLVVDPLRYAWQHPGWMGRPWHETVLYELHVGALGGFDGVRARLPELARLGITAIELMPVAEFPGARNWGYDGVLPFAPEAGYGPPDALKALIDSAHGLGLMVFLDVVYNHFGPEGNYLHHYARRAFRDDVHTPWGAAIDFRQPEVRAFFLHNALMWLMEYRFDGLRLDAVHAIGARDWLEALAARVRQTVEPGRHVHLVLENEHNTASLLRGSAPPGAPGAGAFEAQWNDDGHNALHVLLTGEHEAYYAAYADAPAQRLARVLQDGFCYQGEPSVIHDGAPRGEPSGWLPPTAFVLFLQNHDQIGNRAFGERLTRLAHPDALRAAQVLLLLSPQIPLLFMGEEWGCLRPFLYFTSHHGALAEAVREGRRREFARFAAFADPHQRERIPDPNDERTFLDSQPGSTDPTLPEQLDWLNRTQGLLALRHARIVPRLPGAHALDAVPLGATGALARWRLGDGSVLTLAINLGTQPVAVPTALAGNPADLLHESRDGVAAALAAHRVPPHACIALLHAASTPDLLR
ncbi:malto-oligosyltrehalose trehalohydrolase [Ralstonia pseudosolanacearum]|uniref:malto-oligosyltrehalose trehalohydrolase n=1 Tax=Ralstonia pseudosolanacearum TaxID=1310165 RepID=UPI000B92F0C3|nr:malto-oligosyltrehalose trehalohydrolase [Ralstonia pseudosolanacearum]MCD9230574.1 malto-oligosyltrehalose trehalohydrolase [Ralstonia pseudosolanacearum]